MLRAGAIVLLAAAIAATAAAAESTTEKIHRLGKLAAQAFNQKNVARGERFMQEALDTAESYVTSHAPEAFGEYPHVLKAYLTLVEKRIGVYTAQRQHRSAIDAGTAALSTIETVIGKLSDTNLAPIKDVTEAYFRILERVFLAEMSRGGETESVTLMGRGMDAYEGLMGSLQNRLARNMVVKQYCELAGKLAKYYLGLGRTDYATQVLSRARDKLSANLGADHPVTKAMEGHLEKLAGR